MDGWIDRFAESLGEDPLSGDESARLLAAAREVAHRVERKITPLAAYLLGTAAGRSMAAGASRDDALEAVLETLTSLLPPATAEG